jgi:hypothetical protein
MHARVTLSAAGGAALDTTLDALLTPALREQSRNDANAWIKRLRRVPYGRDTMRTRFTYRGDSLWWFTELYLHKMRRLDAAVAAVHALDAALRAQAPAAIAIESNDPIVHRVADGFRRARGIAIECRGTERPPSASAWPGYVRHLTAQLSRMRSRAPQPLARRPAIAAFVHSAFWREAAGAHHGASGEHYIGPVLDALMSRLESGELHYVGVGPRRNFRARRWWDPLMNSGGRASVTPIERLAPASALRDSRALWGSRRDLARALTGGDGIREAAIVNGVDLWAILQPELDAVAWLQWPWSTRAMDEAAAAFETLAPDLVLTYAEAGGWGRALILEARRRGIRSIGLQHGFIYRHWLNYLHEPDEFEREAGTPPFPRPDRTLLFDGLAAEHLRRAGRFPPDALEVTGNPRLDELRRRVHAIAPAERAATRQRLGADADTPLALLAAKHSEIREELPALRAALESRPHLRLAVKPHPAETTDVYAPLADGLRNVAVAAPDDDLAALLHAADLIVTRNSTVAVDGLVLGVPALVFGLPSNLSPFVEAGAMAGAADGTQLAGALESLMYNRDRRRQLMDAGTAFASRAELSADGRAADRTAGAILDMRRAVT